MTQVTFWAKLLAMRTGLGFVFLYMLVAFRAEAQEPTPSTPAASPSPTPSGTLSLEEMTLEQILEMNIEVVSSTKTKMRGAQTPAVITVITSEEIEARGYRSLAEALRTVPGLYDIYDGVFHDVAVRGISGGNRAAGNVIKLMIDGMPVDFAPTTGNFYGEELIPLSAIARIEIIRGPASALYGANAFLGVVNVITRTGADFQGTRASVSGGTLDGNAGGGASVAGGATGGAYDGIAAASGWYLDRSGKSLPDESPRFSTFSSRGDSRGDLLRPRSAFFKQSFSGAAGGTLSVAGSIQSLVAANEFNDISPLTHGNRVALLNQNYRAMWEIAPIERLSLSLSGLYSRAQGTKDYRFDINDPKFDYLPQIAAQAAGVAAEAHLAAGRGINLTAGGDYDVEDQALQSFSRLALTNYVDSNGLLIYPIGTILPGQGSGRKKTFRNIGAYGQAVATWGDLVLAAGARLDRHSIYGNNFSSRAGIVYAPSDRPLSVKLLYGSSFKAPSAVQLYTQPMANLDIEGNPKLRPQTASTYELAASYGLPHERGELGGGLFYTTVDRLVQFIQQGNFLQAQNLTRAEVAGAEMDVRVAVARSLRARLAGGFAKTVSKGGGDIPGAPRVLSPRFPDLQAHLTADWEPGVLGLRVAPELSWIGEREATQSNALIQGSDYKLPAYTYAALAVSTGALKILPGVRPTRVALRVGNALGTKWVEPGFGGVDLPSPGTSAFLTITQSL